jgi:AraC-like DNA-binding protein
MNIEKIRDLGLEYMQKDGDLPGLTVLRHELRSQTEAVIYEPVICLILQGRKETWIGDQFVDLGPGDLLIVSHDLPVQSRITEASPQSPYLAVIVQLDLATLRGLNAQITDLGLPESTGKSLAMETAEPYVVLAIERYMALHDAPMDAQVLGAAMLREIHYRLLLCQAGAMLRRLLVTDSHANRIAQAILRLRRDFRKPLSLPELSRTAGMSATSFHQHFRAVTGTTPLQYLKDLRLTAARAELEGSGRSVTEVAYALGYESPAHFSRDYKRKFGKSPGQAKSNDRGDG